MFSRKTVTINDEIGSFIELGRKIALKYPDQYKKCQKKLDIYVEADRSAAAIDFGSKKDLIQTQKHNDDSLEIDKIGDRIDEEA